MPTIAPNANAGTGATASFTGASTDRRGRMTLVTGSGSYATGAQVGVTFDSALPTVPSVVIAPASTATVAADQLEFFVVASTTGFTINSDIADDESNTYDWYYQVQG